MNPIFEIRKAPMDYDTFFNVRFVVPRYLHASHLHLVVDERHAVDYRESLLRDFQVKFDFDPLKKML